MSLRTITRRSLAAAAILVASAGAAGAQSSGAGTDHGPTTDATAFDSRSYGGLITDIIQLTGPAVTPEPASVPLLGAGLAATFGAVARRRRALSA